MKKSIVIALIASVFMLGGCSQKTAPDPELIKKYRLNTPKIAPDETLVHVIRENSFIGGGKSLLIGYNDTRYNISNGASCMFKLKNKINTLSATTDTSMFVAGEANPGEYPHSYFPINNRSGEAVFVYYELFKGFREVDKEFGMSIVEASKSQSCDAHGYDYGHQIALMNPSFTQHTMRQDTNNNSLAISNLMKKEDVNTVFDATKAKIVFYRTENLNGWKNLEFGIWGQNAFIGELKGDEYLEVDVIPGKHQFFTKYGSWGVLDANVEAGKTYYVEVFAKMGWDEIYIQLIPKKADVTLDQINKQMINFTKVTLDKSKIDASVQLRLDAALPYIENVLTNPSTVRIDSHEEIKPSDGR